MARRKKPVTLAPVPSLTRADEKRRKDELKKREQEERQCRVDAVRARAERELADRKALASKRAEAAKAARSKYAAARRDSSKRLKDFGNTGYRRPDGPTPERLLRSGLSARVEPFNEVVEIAKGDKFEPTPVGMVRFRVEDSVIRRLTERRLLDRDDPSMNALLGQAGENYFKAFMRAGLNRLGSVDFEREGGCAFGPGALFASEAQIQAWQAFNAARGKVHEDFRPCVDAIVLYDRNPVEVGREIGAYHAEKQATAVAIFVLRRGLKALAHHFGLLSHSDAPK
jgi:hypothetical protein